MGTRSVYPLCLEIGCGGERGPQLSPGGLAPRGSWRSTSIPGRSNGPRKSMDRDLEGRSCVPGWATPWRSTSRAGKFDAVFSFGVLHHMEDWRKAVKRGGPGSPKRGQSSSSRSPSAAFLERLRPAVHPASRGRGVRFRGVQGGLGGEPDRDLGEAPGTSASSAWGERRAARAGRAGGGQGWQGRRKSCCFCCLPGRWGDVLRADAILGGFARQVSRSGPTRRYGEAERLDREEAEGRREGVRTGPSQHNAGLTDLADLCQSSHGEICRSRTSLQAGACHMGEGPGLRSPRGRHFVGEDGRSVQEDGPEEETEGRRRGRRRSARQAVEAGRANRGRVRRSG